MKTGGVKSKNECQWGVFKGQECLKECRGNPIRGIGWKTVKSKGFEKKKE